MSDSPAQPVPLEDGQAACVATIGRDERGRFVVAACNRQFLRMTGRSGGDFPLFPIAFDTLMADSSARQLRAALLDCFAADARHEADVRLDFADGARGWRLTLQPVRHAGEHGAPVVRQVLVTGFDLGTQREPLAQPDVAAARYRELVDLAYDAIVTIDQDRNITLFNRAAENLFGYASAEILGRPIETLLPERFRAGHPGNVKHFADTFQPSVRHATPPAMDGSNSVYGLHRDGSIIPVEIAISKIAVNGRTEFTAVVRDITDRARLMETLKLQAATDALTGLPNRRGFLEFAERVLGAGEVLSVFILDIDFFKDINDNRGHDAGDEVLRLLAKVGASMAHGPNLFARWGGEEFVAALPGADAALVRTIADRLRERFERQDFEHAWRVEAIPFTVSIGVVTREPGDHRSDVEALMKRADLALYRAKQSGRNRVEVG